MLLLQRDKTENRSGCSGPHQLCKHGNFLAFLHNLLQCLVILAVENVSLYLSGAPLGLVYVLSFSTVQILALSPWCPWALVSPPGWTSAGPSTSLHQPIAPAHLSQPPCAELIPLCQLLFCPEGLKLDARIQMQPNKCQVRWDDDFPSSLGYPPVDTVRCAAKLPPLPGHTGKPDPGTALSDNINWFGN